MTKKDVRSSFSTDCSNNTWERLEEWLAKIGIRMGRCLVNEEPCGKTAVSKRFMV
jgi:hypothetical protein